VAQDNELAKMVTNHKTGEDDFEYVEVNNNSAHAKIALQGAHIFDYAREGEEPILWLSEVSSFKYTESIRGGIPICWPWFGLHKDESLPQHGFARTAKFKLINIDESDANTTELIFTLYSTPQTMKLWPYKFELELKVAISDKLTMELKTTNTDDKAFLITEALHTYFAISHISEISINGLDKKPYLDALSMEQKKQSGKITFKQEVDRVYQEVDREILLEDKNRTLKIENEGSSSVVVWNPWIEKCRRMSAMKPDSYESMVCIESANAFSDSRVIKPKESHTLKVTIC